MTLFVDTWGWLALHDRGERQHAAVREIVAAARKPRDGLATSDFVLDETITLLFRRLHVVGAESAMRQLLGSVTAGHVQLVRIDERLFEEAVELRSTYRDKPDISFTDLTSMAAMRALGITDVITEDRHFEHVGLGFKRVP